jgi:hypothetical protein
MTLACAPKRCPIEGTEHELVSGVPISELELNGLHREDAMNRHKLRTRLRDVNIKHSRLVRDKSAPDRFVQMAALRTERAMLLGLLGGDPRLRLVSDQDSLPMAHRQSA